MSTDDDVDALRNMKMPEENNAQVTSLGSLALGGEEGCLPGTEDALDEMKRLEEEAEETTKEIVIAARLGAGMFTEAFFIFSIGNMHSLWLVQFPQCFTTEKSLVPVNSSLAGTCNEAVVDSITYVEVSAIILGMVTFGLLGNNIGRRAGSRMSVSIMLCGAIIIVASSGPPSTLFIVFNIGLAVLAVAVGAEYPLTSSNSAENAETDAKPYRRGFAKSAAFAMQGWGNFVNTAIILIIVVANGSSVCVPGVSSSLINETTCSNNQLDMVWRVSYGIGIIVVLAVATYRFVFMKESKVWEKRQKELKDMGSIMRKKESGMALKTMTTDPLYVARFVACCACWYVWDIVFYGNRLFQSTIIAITLGGNPNLYDIYSYTLLNATVALVGYYLCAATVDSPWFGRTRIQGMGFLIMSIMFLTCGFYYDTLITPSHISAFQAMYFLSTFFGQWGPNGTTFILPSELFPTDVRTSTHGAAAACGKLGALTSTLVFTYGNGGRALAPANIFIVNGFAALVGLVLTVAFIPNTTRLAMAEVDRLWECRLLGKEYEGPAIAYENLSYFEAIMHVATGKTQIWYGHQGSSEIKKDATGTGIDTAMATDSTANINEVIAQSSSTASKDILSV